MSKVGELLKQTRENLGYDFDKITSDIRLSADILVQLEEGGFTQLPSYNHAKNFVKNYAEYLGLDVESTLELLAEECTKTDFTHEPITVATDEPLEEIVKSDNSGGSKLFIVILFIIIIGIVGFLVFRAGNHDKKSSEVQPQQNVTEQQAAVDEKPEPDDNEFNTVDKKILEETISSVNETENADAAQTADGAKTEVADGKMPAVSGDKITPAGTEERKLPNGLKKATLSFADVCWVHFKSDTGEELDFIADRANQKEVTFKEHFFLDIGNAAVASVNYNGKVTAGFGGYKQPVKGLKFEPNPENGGLKYTIVK